MKRGPYRRYNKDPSIPIPKTSSWKRKKELQKLILAACIDSDEGEKIQMHICHLDHTTLAGLIIVRILYYCLPLHNYIDITEVSDDDLPKRQRIHLPPQRYIESKELEPPLSPLHTSQPSPPEPLNSPFQSPEPISPPQLSEFETSSPFQQLEPPLSLLHISQTLSPFPLPEPFNSPFLSPESPFSLQPPTQLSEPSSPFKQSEHAQPPNDTHWFLRPLYQGALLSTQDSWQAIMEFSIENNGC